MTGQTWFSCSIQHFLIHFKIYGTDNSRHLVNFLKEVSRHKMLNMNGDCLIGWTLEIGKESMMLYFMGMTFVRSITVC